MTVRSFVVASVFLIALVIASPSVRAAPIQWSGNGHWYDINPTPLYWQDARAAAESMTFANYSGNLVTITSAAENDWLFVTFGPLLSNPFHWIGAFQPDATLLDEGWTWVTGEPWSYENWAAGEPNDYFATDPSVGMYEDVVHFFPLGGTQWADTISTIEFPSVVEYGPPFAVPEPLTLSLFAAGLASLGVLGWRKRKAV